MLLLIRAAFLFSISFPHLKHFQRLGAHNFCAITEIPRINIATYSSSRTSTMIDGKRRFVRLLFQDPKIWQKIIPSNRSLPLP